MGNALAENVYAVILAGGSGTRFWPKSRLRTPKQLCKIGDPDFTMLEKTLQRLDNFVPPERRLIVTHQDQIEKTKQVVGKSVRHFIAEPEARNTANALAVAALALEKLAGRADIIMVSLHADHVITDTDSFRATIRSACAVANEKFLTLIGIKPSSPETCYGYLEKGSPIAAGIDGSFRVANFREKPDLATAKKYVQSGRYFWNSGYFVWRVDTLMAELEKYLPISLRNLREYSRHANFFAADIKKFSEVYSQLPAIAIDNAVLEKSEMVAFVEGHFPWYDVGSWDALGKCFATDAEGNYVQGDSLLLDCQGMIVDGGEMFVACVGVKDLVVTYANGAILVCPKDRSQDVKLVVEELKRRGRTDLT